MQILFIMDPALGMLPDKDTTFALVRGAMERGHTCLHAEPRSIDLFDGKVWARARSLTVSQSAPHVVLGEEKLWDLAELDGIMIRKDPPFDTAYLHLTQELELVKDKVFICNSPQGLRDANEKIFALHFEKWMPRTMVTSDREKILSFVKDVGGAAVLKPLDGAGGSGVVALRTGDKNARALTDILTFEGKEQAMVQAFQPQITEGDKRVLLLNGKCLGVILRVPRADDIRANIHVGGSVQKTTLTPQEQDLVDDVGPQLAAQGLFFVGLDLIGGKLIEVNVTSPTGIQELGRLTQSSPELDVIDWIESKAKELS